MQISKAACTTGLIAALLLSAGCASTSDAQKGTVLGAGLGALAGQAIGGDTSATLIGAAVGAGVGYVIGNERDKEKARQLNASSAGPGAIETAPFGGTRWELIDWQPRNGFGDQFQSKVFDFKNDGQLVTTTTGNDGSVRTERENYRVVGDKLVVNKPGYIVNYRFDLSGPELRVATEKVRAVLRRM